MLVEADSGGTTRSDVSSAQNEIHAMHIFLYAVKANEQRAHYGVERQIKPVP